MTDLHRVPPASRTWGKKARALWRQVCREWQLGPDALEVLRTACDSLDRYHRAQRVLQIEGLTFSSSSGQLKKHPCCEIVKNERAGFLAAIRVLGLEQDGDKSKEIGRPDESWKKSQGI